jgi:hypothetical protein
MVTAAAPAIAAQIRTGAEDLRDHPDGAAALGKDAPACLARTEDMVSDMARATSPDELDGVVSETGARIPTYR